MSQHDRPDDAPPESAGRVTVYGIGSMELTVDTWHLIERYLELAQTVLHQDSLLAEAVGPEAVKRAKERLAQT